MKKRILLSIFTIPFIVLNLYADSTGKNDSPRVKHEWRYSSKGSEKYSQSLVFTKKWNVKDDLPLNQDGYYKLYETDCGGKIYIYYIYGTKSKGQELFKYNRDGKLLYHFTNLQGIGFEFYADDNETMYFYSAYDKEGTKITKDNKVKELKEEEFNKVIKKETLGLKREYSGAKSELVLSNNDKMISKIDKKDPSYDIEQGHLIDIHELGVTKGTNIFIISRLHRKNEREDEAPIYVVDKYSEKGELLTKIYSKPNVFAKEYESSMYAVDKCENVYQLWMDEDSFSIIKWSKKDEKK
jgi:hypothetical protein